MTDSIKIYAALERDINGRNYLIETPTDCIYKYRPRTYSWDFIYTKALNDVLISIAEMGIKYVFVKDPIILYDLDKWAFKSNIPIWQDITQLCGKRTRLGRDVDWAYGYRETGDMSLSRKVWVRAISKTDKNRRLSLKTITFLNFSHMLGHSNDIKDLKTNPDDTLWDAIINYNKVFASITGRPYLGAERPAAWTIGGAAKSLYLNLKYKDNKQGSPLKQYQRKHPQNKTLDYELRTGGALMPGLLYFKDTDIHIPSETQIIGKIDINSFFPYIEKQIGEIYPIKVHPAGGTFILSEQYVYKVNRLTMIKRIGAPALYGVNIDLKGKFVWGFWLKEIVKIYYIVDIDVDEKNIYKICKYCADESINDYVDSLYKQKQAATKSGYRRLYKLFINNLHGKFVQSTVRDKFVFDADFEADIYKLKKIGDIEDIWDSTHFDFFRGAAIYAASNALLIHYWFDICNKFNLDINSLLYADTDCLIYEARPEKFPNSRELGEFKLEATYKEFKAYGKKRYAGIMSFDYNVVCAGLPKEDIRKAITAYVGSAWVIPKNMAQLDKVLSAADFGVTVTEVTKTCLGGEYKKVLKRFEAPYIEEEDI